ncbi:MAG: hypothetical protein DWQ02_27685 [Bacteroidetes bacterium]|nr:MAG: hypothetical protein DWQ02_27685 [Bacteroidota bacterium]
MPVFFLLSLAQNTRCQTLDAPGIREQNDIALNCHLLLDLNSTNLNIQDSIFSDSIPLAVILSGNPSIDSAFLQKCETHLQKLVIINDQKIELQNNSLNPKFVLPTDIEVLDIASLSEDEISNLSYDPSKPLVRLNLSEPDIFPDSLLFQIWGNSGKMPNFIFTGSAPIKNAIRIVRLLNDTEKIFGTFNTDTEPLQAVFFKDYHDRKANAFFCYPIIPSEGFPVLIPHNAG